MMTTNIEAVKMLLREYLENNDVYLEVNLIDVIARLRGWLPLEPKQEMIVHFGNKEYKIKRTI